MFNPQSAKHYSAKMTYNFVDPKTVLRIARQIFWWHNKSHQLSEILSQWTWNCEQLDLSIMIKKGYNRRLTGYSYLVLSTLSAAEFEMVPSTSYHLPMIMLNFHSLHSFSVVLIFVLCNLSTLLVFQLYSLRLCLFLCSFVQILIADIIGFHNIYDYMHLWSLRAINRASLKWWRTYIQTHILHFH